MAENPSLTETICFAVSSAGDLPRLVGDCPTPWPQSVIDLLRGFLEALDRDLKASNSLVERVGEFRGHTQRPGTDSGTHCGQLSRTWPEPGKPRVTPRYGVRELLPSVSCFHPIPTRQPTSTGFSTTCRRLQSICARKPRVSIGQCWSPESTTKRQRPISVGPAQRDADRAKTTATRSAGSWRGPLRKAKEQGGGQRAHPKVGVVVVKDGKELAAAYRGELDRGEHAEFTALEKKLKDVEIAGATVYATLEPCTTRNHPKLPCAVRLAERKVRRVVIGMLDPNPDISGKGVQRLREANIAVELLPSRPDGKIEEMNREFIRHHKNAAQAASPDSGGAQG